MAQIHPSRQQITERFPVASFYVEVPPERPFEIVCATDPTLLRPSERHRRTRDNFYTSRGDGLLRARAGRATWMLDPRQLKRFAGSERIYYALASYGSPRGDDARFSTPLERIEETPAIAVSSDFSGRSLGRARFSQSHDDEAAYGNPNAIPLVWGGDMLGPPPEATMNGDAYGGDDEDVGAQSAGEREGDDVDGLAAFGFDDSGAEAEIEEALDVDEDSEGLDAESFADHERYDAVDETAPLAERVDEDEAYGRGHSIPSAPRYAGHAETLAAAVHGLEGNEEALDTPADGLGVAEIWESAPESAFSDDAGAGPDEVYGRASRALDEEGADVAPLASRGEDEAVVDEPQATELSTRRPPEYSDEEPNEDERHVRSVELSIPEKMGILRVVARLQSGNDRYRAMRFDETDGLSWGLLHFSQRSGLLGRVLAAAKRRDAARFREVFGPDGEAVLRVTTGPSPEARLAPIGDEPLGSPRWREAFISAASIPAFQAAQHEVAIEGVVDPTLPFAAGMGLDSDRGLAILLDRCTHLGLGGGKSWIAKNAGPVRTLADRAAALRAAGYGSLSELQAAKGLPGNGQWNASTHAILAGVLRGLGAGSPVLVPARDEVLDRLVTAAARSPWGQRVRWLRTTRDLRDTVYRLG